MSAGARGGRLRAVRGFLKAAWMLFMMLCLLPVWLVRGVATRAKFRAELRAAGVPAVAAKSLSDKYKLRLRDLGRIGLAAGKQV